MSAYYSIEATRPNLTEIGDVAAIVARGTRFYLSAVPTQSFAELASTAHAARKAGLEPVPHLPARRFASLAELDELLARLRDLAGVREVLVVAGDVDVQGPFTDALALIRSGSLQKAGIAEIGVSGYPEGHPLIAAEKIETALNDKIAAAKAAGLRLHVVSQFSFAPDAIVAWLKHLRARGIAAPVRAGMAGPTNVPALLRYAKRCGVNASLRGLMSGAAAGLLTGRVGPDRILDALAAARAEIGDVRPHYFSFGGLADTARFARDAAIVTNGTRRAS